MGLRFVSHLLIPLPKSIGSFRWAPTTAHTIRTDSRYHPQGRTPLNHLKECATSHLLHLISDSLFASNLFRDRVLAVLPQLRFTSAMRETHAFPCTFEDDEVCTLVGFRYPALPRTIDGCCSRPSCASVVRLPRILMICLDFSFTTVWILVGTVRQISTTHSRGTWRSRLDRTVILVCTGLTRVNPTPTSSCTIPFVAEPVVPSPLFPRKARKLPEI